MPTLVPTSVILLCGGRGDRWDNHLGITKHMAPIGGEPLIVRTCRQLRDRLGVEPWVVASDPRILALGLRNCTNYDARFCSAGALSTLPLWTERTFILFGDTYFDGKTMNAICASTGLRAFWTKSQFVGYHWDSAVDRARAEAAIRSSIRAQSRALSAHSPRGMGYLNYSYYLLIGYRETENPAKDSHDKKNAIVSEASGVCMDFDYPCVYDDFLREVTPDDLL